LLEAILIAENFRSLTDLVRNSPFGTSAIKYAIKKAVAAFVKSFPFSLRSLLIPITAAYYLLR